MSESIPKPIELQKAQLAAFATDTLQPKDREFVIQNIGQLAVERPPTLRRVIEEPERHEDESGQRVRYDIGEDRLVATKQDVTTYLRKVGGQGSEAINGRYKLLTAYTDFAPDIEVLRTELHEPEKRKSHPEFIGNGSNSEVFKIEKDGTQYAVRVPSGARKKPEEIDSHMAAAILAKGLPHLEQIVAASYEDGMTVAELMPGKEISKVSVEELAAISDEQIAELVETVVAMDKRGLSFDPKPSNIFYDSEQGFGIIDFYAAHDVSRFSAEQNLATKLIFMAGAVRSMGVMSNAAPKDDAAYYRQELKTQRASLSLLTRYRSSVEKQVSDKVEAAVAIEGIDKNIDVINEAIDQYSDPRKVHEAILSHREYLEEQQAKFNSASALPPQASIKAEEV